MLDFKWELKGTLLYPFFMPEQMQLTRKGT